jgi:hypothetical protein
MSNVTYLASRRTGGRRSCAQDKRRISVTVPEETFLALRERADRQHRGLSGEASELLSYAVRVLSGKEEQP